MYLAGRFWSKAQIVGDEECWLWTASKCGAGYGKFRYGAKHTIVSAHRVAYELTHGIAVPKGVEVCHICDNKACVNPRHLFIGTRAENMCDMYRKGRHPNLKLNPKIVSDVLDDLEMGFSQARVAGRHGIDQTTVSRIKRSKVLQFIPGGSGLPPLPTSLQPGGGWVQRKVNGFD